MNTQAIVQCIHQKSTPISNEQFKNENILNTNITIQFLIVNEEKQILDTMNQDIVFLKFNLISEDHAELICFDSVRFQLNDKTLLGKKVKSIHSYYEELTEQTPAFKFEGVLKNKIPSVPCFTKLEDSIKSIEPFIDINYYNRYEFSKSLVFTFDFNRKFIPLNKLKRNVNFKNEEVQFFDKNAQTKNVFNPDKVIILNDDYYVKPFEKNKVVTLNEEPIIPSRQNIKSPRFVIKQSKSRTDLTEVDKEKKNNDIIQDLKDLQTKVDGMLKETELTHSKSTVLPKSNLFNLKPAQKRSIRNNFNSKQAINFQSLIDKMRANKEKLSNISNSNQNLMKYFSPRNTANPNRSSSEIIKNEYSFPKITQVKNEPIGLESINPKGSKSFSNINLKKYQMNGSDNFSNSLNSGNMPMINQSIKESQENLISKPHLPIKIAKTKSDQRDPDLFNLSTMMSPQKINLMNKFKINSPKYPNFVQSSEHLELNKPVVPPLKRIQHEPVFNLKPKDPQFVKKTLDSLIKRKSPILKPINLESSNKFVANPTWNESSLFNYSDSPTRSKSDGELDSDSKFISSEEVTPNQSFVIDKSLQTKAKKLI